MTEEIKVDELSEKLTLTKVITWKILNFFSLPDNVDFSMDSSRFAFANATWCLGLYPNGNTDDESEGIDLTIERLRSIIPNQSISYSFAVMTRDGKTYDIYKSGAVFENDAEVHGVVNLVKRSKILAERNTIASGSTVTFRCKMWIDKETGIDASSQTESPEPFKIIVSELKLPIVASSNKVLHDYKKLLLSGAGSDVTIRVKGQEFPAHRAFLGARSPVFASMFAHDTKEKATGVIDVEDCEPAIFPDFLHFLYCGSVKEFSAGNVSSLYTAADKYDVQDLKSECVEFMKCNLSVDTFCDTIALSLQHCETELVKRATDFFALNLTKIIETVKWQTFLAENPIESNELLIKAMRSYKLIIDT